jgi:glucose/arabinose dehydrogenase
MLTGAPLGWSDLPIDIELAAGSLTNVTSITHAGDGSGRLFITQQAGQIKIFDGTQVLATNFLPVAPLVVSGDEQGLLSAAFSPGYRTNGLFYLFYTRSGDGALTIARYSVSANPNVANTNGTVLLTIAHPTFANHNGGQLQFGADQFLYIGTGDGGSGCDPANNAQNLNSLLGKLLRIDVRNVATSYSIPLTNPFVETPNARDEIWAYGLRNPWRFSFDRATGDLFIGDVGQNVREELNYQIAGSPGGQNYGWRCFEGSLTNTCGLVCSNFPSVLPIVEYSHASGNCSITGGYVYRGTAIPELIGTYLYADYCTGRIWGAAPDGSGGWKTNEFLDTALNISTFGEDEAGELYVSHHSSTAAGAIYRIVAGPRITGVQMSGPNALISFTTRSNRLYRAERADDMFTGAWSLLTNNVAGTGGVVQIIDAGAASSTNRFYRIRLLP